MTPILHHYDFSNYSEKVRLALGLKGLAWRSVDIPATAPKPDYTPLTAGYRRTPALQIGADVHCDTRRVLAVLEAAHPRPSLYPGPDPARTRALCDAITHWAETSLMRPVALFITARHARDFPDAFHADRAHLHRKSTPTVARVEASGPRYRAQVDCQLPAIEALLGHGGGFVLPEGPSAADLAVYEAPWFLRTIGGEAALPPGLPRLRAWMERVAALGHGRPTPTEPEDALAEARAATPVPVAPGPEPTPEGARAGDEVTVSPFDQRSPASGRLVRADGERIVIASDHPRTGTVHVHFPRVGYRLEPRAG